MKKHLLAVILLVLLLWLLAALGTASGSPGIFTVNTTDDPGDGTCDASHCSLREAINAANNNTGSDTIEFDIATSDPGYGVSGITGTWTISLTSSSLPTLTDDGTIISGTTQAVNQGDVNPDGPEIEISGASLSGVHCLVIESASNVIHGLVINRCPLIGVLIQKAGSDYNTVSGNYIGIDASGSTDLGNGTTGVMISDGSQGNVVGGNTPEERNVISGNGLGVSITGSGTTSNTVSGNYIGTDHTGVQDLGNDGDGVAVYNGAQNNTIGGDSDGERNIISGNNGRGVNIEGSGTVSNTVSGNFIGTVVTGTESLGNTSFGVGIGSGAQNNIIGGDSQWERNVISGNLIGVSIGGTAPMSNTVSGNYIGTDASGSSGLGNSNYGVRLAGTAQNNIIGGDSEGERNIISGNDQYGVNIYGNGVAGNTISGNYIGTDATGTQELGNGLDGVIISDGAQNNTIGPHNIIAWNVSHGVLVSGSGSTGNTVTQNSIHSNGDLGIDNFDGGNLELPGPVIESASCAAISGTAPLTSTVEIFTGPDEEGKTYLGTAYADGSGNWSATGIFSLDTYVTATATDSGGNTSEFSDAVAPACYRVFLPLIVKDY